VPLPLWSLLKEKRGKKTVSVWKSFEEKERGKKEE